MSFLEAKLEKLSSIIVAAIADDNVIRLEKALTDPDFEAPILMTPTSMGVSPFRFCARSGSAAIVEMLMDYAADPNRDPQPFLLAASWGNIPAIRVMINRSTDVNSVGTGRQTALIAAVKASRLHAAQELVLAGASVNVDDSKKNTPLSLAWANNDLELVRFLVKYGAEVGIKRWISAPESGANMSLHLTEGISMHIAKDPDSRSNVIPDLPVAALPSWILLAPGGACLLLDSILIQEVRNSSVPQRAEFHGNRSLLAVCTPQTEFDRTAPIFKTLVPKDFGRGTQVMVSMLLIRGVLTSSVLHSIALCPQPTTLLDAHGIKGILSVLWDFHVQNVFHIDLAFECVNVVTFVLWTVFVVEGFNSRSYTYSKWVSLILLFIVVVRELMQQIGNVHFSARMQNESFFSRRSFMSIDILSAADIVMSIALICTSGIADTVFTHQPYDYVNPPTHLTILSFVAYFRWLRIINYLCAFQSVGAKILPIVKCFASIGAFLAVFALVLCFLMHGTYVFYFPDERFGSIFDFFMRQYFLGMVSRWPIFLQKLESDGIYLHDTSTPRGVWVDEFDKQHNPFFGYTNQCKALIETKTSSTKFMVANRLESQFYPVIIFWYVASAILIGIVMLQIFVGVLSQAYAKEKARAHISFAQRRSEITYTYFLNRTLQQKGSKILNVFRFCIGSVKKPAENGFVWICSKTQHVTDSPDNLVETSKKKEYLYHQMCKKLSDTVANREERILHLTTMLERVEGKLEELISKNDARTREQAHLRR